MKLIEENTVPESALPVDALKAHLRLGTGFDEDSVQTPVLAGFLRAAIAAIEVRTAKALFQRDFTLRTSEWQRPDSETLPVAPVEQILSMALIDRAGDQIVIASDRYVLVEDSTFPRIKSSGAILPSIPTNGTAEIRFRAGIATEWSAFPPDMAQAVMMLAAHYYEYRYETSLSDGCMPFGVTSLIQRYRPVRLTLGVAR